jgi:site-specific DNA-methyltransferase (adenine-specific)
MQSMKAFPDNYFDLACVDPPYGSGNPEKDEQNGALVERSGGQWAKKYEKNIKSWDIAPPIVYFDELFRISRQQIIWGGNYFRLPPTRCFLVWRKTNISEKFTMAMCEYAWTSFNKNAKTFACQSNGYPSDPRFHPTQKPVALYDWIFKNFAEPGMRVLDTHAGSGSSCIAAHNAGLDWLGFEISPEYHAKAVQRIERMATPLKTCESKQKNFIKT